ncbi:MAG: DUF6382 domain-containing protein [Eubacteriales bacterium]
MEVKFHRDVNHNYMMLQSVETPDPDAYENRVILANRIRGLLPCRLLYLNGDTYYSFDITSMQSLEILRGRRILSGDGFSSFFYELIDVLCGLEEYLLDFDHLILTPDKIFIDPSGGKIGLVYFPSFRKDIRESLRELVEYLLTGTDPDDRRTTLLGYRVYHALRKEELLLGELRGLLTESEPETETPERPGKNRFYEKDVIGPFQQKYAEIHSGGDSDVTYSETYRSGSGPETMSYRLAEKVPKLAVIVFLTVGLLSTAITYAFLHLGLGRILAEHSDLLIRIGGACAVILLFAAAFHFAGKSRKMNTRDVGMPVEEFSGYDPECFSDAGLREEWEDLSGEAGKFRKDPPVEAGKFGKDPPVEAGKFGKDPLGEPGESLKSPFREISPGTEHEEDYTCLLRMERKGEDPGASARLVPLRDDEDSDLTEITLFEGTVIIGKSGELSDRVIPRATVSRVHARIRFSEGACYIMDVNSRNGTFRNGEILPGGEEVRISDGDEISFADAGYRFHMDGNKET